MNQPPAMEIINALCDGLLVAAIGAIIWVIRTLTKLESDVNWIKNSFHFTAASAAMNLHSPHTPEFDRLLEAFWHQTLSMEQAILLMDKLNIASNDLSFDKYHQQFARQAMSALSLQFKIPIPKA